MYATASSGYSPTAVSADSITASVPSRTAFATSLASARVGSGELIIDSSICVAVMTGLPALGGSADDPLLDQRHLGGTDLDAEVAAGDHDAVRLGEDRVEAARSPPAFSILAITRAREPACLDQRRCRSRTSAAERTNESAT